MVNEAQSLFMLIDKYEEDQVLWWCALRACVCVNHAAARVFRDDERRVCERERG